MKFISKNKKKISVFLTIFMLLNFFPIQENYGKDLISLFSEQINRLQRYIGSGYRQALADDDKNYYLKSGNFVVNLSDGGGTGEAFDINVDFATLSLISTDKKDPNITAAVKDATITLNQTEDVVVKESVAENNSGINFKRLGAGSKQISGSVRLSDGGSYNFNFFVKVDLKIKKDPVSSVSSESKIGYAKVFANDISNNTLIMPIVGGKYQVKLEGYASLLSDGTLDYSKSDLIWQTAVADSENGDSVVSVEQSNGMLTAEGAGVAEVEVFAGIDPNKIVKSDRINLLIPLRLSTKNTVLNGKYDSFKDDVEGNTIDLDTGSLSKVIYSNILDPNDLVFEVEKDGRKVKDNSISITEVRQKTDDSPSSFKIVGKRAGTYKIIASLKNIKSAYKDVKQTKVVFNVNVPLVKADKVVYLNVNDTYNIYENSNIGNISDFTYNSDGSGAVSVNQSTAVIRAERTGSSVVTVSDGSTSFTITVIVIESLSLSSSTLTIPVGGEVVLTAQSTDISTSDSWNWFSESTGIATVKGTANQATVRGMAAGETTVVVEHIIDGVSKRAVCKIIVTAAVTKINVSATTTVLEVGQSTAIKADVTPKTSQGSYLYWRSSNPSIVLIDNEDSHNEVTSVTAKAPGIAVIMALNKENVVIGSVTITVNTPVTGIKLSNTLLERPLSEKTYQLTATTLPETATNTTLIWKSTNEKVAIVDKLTGLVTYKNAGHTSIIVSSESNPQIIATCDLTITKSIQGIKLDKTDISLAVGETYKITANITPEDATNTGLLYKSLDGKVATVSNTGLITAKQPGTAYIIVSTTDNKISVTMTVRVLQKATGMKLSAVSIVLDVGESYTIEATFNPKTTTETKIIWSTSDKSIAKVDSRGRVTAVSNGEAIITATSSNGLTAICSVKVNRPVGGIFLDYTEYELAVGDELELEVSFDSEDVTNKKVKWKSSKSSVASVDKNGVVTAKKGGTAIITVTSDENGMSASCVITVQEPISKIILNKTSYKLGYKKTYTLVAKLETNSATNKTLKWSSSKPDIVSVNQSGVIYGKKLGIATITVKATDGSKAMAKAKVRVVREARSISVKPSYLPMVVGEKKRISAVVKPKNATYKTVKYSSENPEIAMVDAKGRITALTSGKTKINVTAKDNSGKKQVVVVSIREYISSTGISLSNTSLTMGIGDRQSIIYSITPSGTDDKVKWSTNNRVVANVNKSGLITALSPGTAVITATTTSGRTAQVQVTVVGLNFNRLDMEQYDTYKLTVLGDVKNVTWDSEDPSIATVSNGVVTAKRAGSTYIRARVNGALLRCLVVVRNIN